MAKPLAPVLLALAALTACAPRVLVPSPADAPATGPAPGAATTAGGVRVEAYPAVHGAPPALSECTPMLVVIDNQRPAPIEVTPADFHLVGGGATFAVADAGVPDQLRFGVLPAGARARGVVCFQRVVGWYGVVDLRMTLVDATNDIAFATADIPFMQARRDACTRPPGADGDPNFAGTIFDTCLP